jgi:glucan phosphoethanolaminetransferase (alkaline phosphatase superfamily)
VCKFVASKSRTEGAAWRAGWVLRLAAVFLLVYATNHGFSHRIERLLFLEKWLVLAIFLAVWGFSILCMVVAALQPSRLLRAFWAAVIALSTAGAHGFYLVSGADFTVYDAVSMWNARHEAGRALDFFQSAGIWALLVLIASYVVFVASPVPRQAVARRYLHRLSWAPAVAIGVMAAILVVRDGSGLQAMPRQFQPLAVSLVAGVKVMTDRVPQRSAVTWMPSGQPKITNIVLLVDESIRPDYIDWHPGNPYTPNLARNRDRFVDFGPAVSGANCSGYSNAILRLGGVRADLVNSVRTNPTIWQFAKSAGFRTVYIDGQSGFIKSKRKLQNFMTLEETGWIDRHVTFDDVPASDLDLEVLRAIREEVSGSVPVFVYANKNGAHFPYDSAYPADQAIFTPTIEASSSPTPEIRVNSYRNAVRWSVDGFFGRLLDDVDLSNTAVIYTSDHGQRLGDGRMTHCTVENPDPRQGLVPLFVVTGNEELKERLASGARLNRARASHFAITPTLLDLMGYPRQSVRSSFGPSLFEELEEAPAFTSESIFGLFRSDVIWTPIDLDTDYLEDFSRSQPPGTPAGILRKVTREGFVPP